MIQSFLKWGEFWEYLLISFKVYGILFKYIKGYGRGYLAPLFRGISDVHVK